MFITVVLLDVNLTHVFTYKTNIDPMRIMISAECLEGESIKNGSTWAAGNVVFYGKQLIRKWESTNEKPPDLEKEIANVVMSIWLFKSLFTGLKAELFMKTSMSLKITPDGTVEIERDANKAG